MNKLVTVLCLFFCMLISVGAQEVFVLNLHYEGEELTITDSIHKYGFYPDSPFTDGAYTLYLLSVDEDILYNLNFDVPLKMFTDVTIDEKIEGSVIMLNATDFSLVIPYYPDAEKIIIYKDKETFIASHDVITKEIPYLLVFFILLFILAIIFVLIRIRKQ